MTTTRRWATDTLASQPRPFEDAPERYRCPCRFEAAPDVARFSPEWYRQHRSYHLAVFANADSRTRDALDTLVHVAEQGESAAPVLLDTGPTCVACGHPQSAFARPGEPCRVNVGPSLAGHAVDLLAICGCCCVYPVEDAS